MLYRIVTGASSNHFLSLKQLLVSLKEKAPEAALIVWDLGLTEQERTYLEGLFMLKIRVFDYNKYPAYYNIAVNAGEYAWKPALIKETVDAEGAGLYLWLDAGNVVIDSLVPLIDFIDRTGLYSNVTSANLTYPGIFSAIEPHYRQFEQSSMRNGAIIGFNADKEWVRALIERWAAWASDKRIIAPEGSSRRNHRQDQSLLTLLFWEAAIKYGFDTKAEFKMIKIHMDCD
jgi:hypothetical protein